VGSSSESGDLPDSDWKGKPDCGMFDQPEPNASLSVAGEGCLQVRTVLAVVNGDSSMGGVSD